MTCTNHINAWWASLRIPQSRRYNIHECDMGKWARWCGQQPNPDESAHHINAIAIWSHKDCPGDPWLGFRQRVETFFADQRAKENEIMAKSKTKDKKDVGVERIPCQFTGLSVGKEVYGLGLKIPRTRFSSRDAERLLCGARLKVRVVKDANADLDTREQQTFANPDSCDVIESTVDVKHYAAARKHFTAKLAFAASEIDRPQMLEFLDEKGYVELERIGDADEKKAKAKGDVPGQATMEGGDDEEDE